MANHSQDIFEWQLSSDLVKRIGKGDTAGLASAATKGHKFYGFDIVRRKITEKERKSPDVIPQSRYMYRVTNKTQDPLVKEKFELVSKLRQVESRIKELGNELASAKETIESKDQEIEAFRNAPVTSVTDDLITAIRTVIHERSDDSINLLTEELLNYYDTLLEKNET